MEEAKVIDVAGLLGTESLESLFWQWQSGPNPDPWAEKDPAQWTWQDYSDDDCHIIEKAFLLKKEIADLKDYEVDLKKMVQVNKKFRNRVRRVRRQEKSRFMMEMSEPVAVMKDQKTMNQAFGTIQHFLDYIMKTTPEAYGLYQRLKTLSLGSKNHEFGDIIHEVVKCIEKGAEVREKVIKTRMGLKTKNFIFEGRRIVNVILDHSAFLGGFLKAILRVYTMETFTCYWLNELLRSENWEEINVLAPYLVCLVYTFKCSEYIVKYQEPHGLVKNLLGLVVKPKLSLYRGAALAKEHLELYDPKKIKYFSWNAVTSTSRGKHIALDFIRLSLAKAKKLNESKVGVFFKIETDFASSEDCEGMIDVSHNSNFPDEQEIILAPGTVFRLIKVSLIENNIYKINLKATKKFENTKENIDLLGALQDQAISKDKAVIDGLPSQQSFRLLELLKGNKLIRRLEIRNSGIEDHIMEEIENLRLTMNVKREDVKLIDNTIAIENLTPFAPYLSLELVASNRVRFKERNPKVPLKNQGSEAIALILSEECLENFKQKYQLKELSEKIASADQIVSLDLSISKMEGSNCEWTKFLQCISKIKNLQSLGLKINKECFVTRKTLEALGKIIGSLKTMNRLSLGLSLWAGEMKFLKETLESIFWIQSLSLDLKFDKKISNGELNHIKSGLVSLPSIQYLSLNFERCCNISDEGLNFLKRGLLLLPSLQHLSLSFSGCYNISNEGLDHLKSGFLSLKSLRHLSLNFSGCYNIFDEGLNHLVLLSFSSVQHLYLGFSGCYNISDEGLNFLKRGLLLLPSLHHLSLHFNWCENISNEGKNRLHNELKSISSLIIT